MKKICFWCGKNHRKNSKVCDLLSKKANEACKIADYWIVMGVLEAYGPRALDDFEIYAVHWSKGLKRKTK